jgi:AsmA protein
VHANVTRFKDGTTNFDDLLIRNETLSPVTFDIDGVRITDSSINFQDEIKWRRVALQDVQIETGRLADTVPSQLKASFHLNSERIHSDTAIELKSRLLYDRKASRYEFADLEGKLEGTAAGFSNLDLNFKGSMDINLLQESLLAENLYVSGTGNYGQRSIEVKLGVPKLIFAKGKWIGNQLALDTNLSQFDEKWTTSLQIPAFDFANMIFNTAELSADFDFKGEGRSLQGKLSSPASVSFETMPKLTFNTLAMNLAVKYPILAGELSATASGSMRADISEQIASMDFKAKIDDNKIVGKMALKDFSHPSYTFNLNVNHLPLDRYIAADWIKQYQKNSMQLDLGGIKDLNLRGSLHVGEINFAKLDVSKLDAEIKIEQSALMIAPLTAKLYGGSLAGSISLAAQGTPQITIKQHLKGFQAHGLLADMAGTDKLTGKGNLAADISAEGVNIGALRKTLNGSITLDLERGSLAGIDMRSALIEGNGDLGTKNKAHVHEAKFSERTDFSELRTVINIVDGNSRGNSFDLRSPMFRITGEGDLALDTGNLSYRLTAKIASTLNKKTSRELAEMKGISVPIHVSGPWVAPFIALDFSAASGGIVPKRIAAIAAEEQAAVASKHKIPAKKRTNRASNNP